MSVCLGLVNLLLARECGMRGFIKSVVATTASFDHIFSTAVVAAVVSGFVALVVVYVNKKAILKINNDRIEADRSLAKEKIEADIYLAKNKFDFERQQVIFRRRYELAEEILADSYHLRSLMEFARNSFSWGTEGSTRVADKHEAIDVKQIRDQYFIPQKRLNEESVFLSAMFARRASSHAHFGNDAEKAFLLFLEAVQKVRTSSSLLILWADDAEIKYELVKKLRRDIWRSDPGSNEIDEVGTKIEEAVKLIENLTRPALEAGTVI